MQVIDRLTNKKVVTSAALAERTAQERDEVAAREVEIGALRVRAGALAEELERLIVGAALDGAANTTAITRTRAEQRDRATEIEALTERNASAALVIRELEVRHHSALIAENTTARQKLAADYAELTTRVRALLLQAGSLQEKAIRTRNEEAELAGLPFMQGAGGLPAPSMIQYRALGPDLSRVAEGYAIADGDDVVMKRLMRVG